MTRLPPPLHQALDGGELTHHPKLRALVQEVVDFYEGYIDVHCGAMPSASVSANGTSAAQGKEEEEEEAPASAPPIGPAALVLEGVSCSLPLRKRCRISLHQEPELSLLLSAPGDDQATATPLHRLSLTTSSPVGHTPAVTVLVLPTPYKPSFHVCLLPLAGSAPGSEEASNAQQVLFTIPDKAPLLALLACWSIPVLQDGEAFRSAKVRNQVRLPFLECRVGVKESFLYPLASGLFLGFKRPLLFLPHARIRSASTRSAHKLGSLVLELGPDDAPPTGSSGDGDDMSTLTIDGLDTGLLEELDQYLARHREAMGTAAVEGAAWSPSQPLAHAPLMESDAEDGDFMSGTSDSSSDSGSHSGSDEDDASERARDSESDEPGSGNSEDDGEGKAPPSRGGDGEDSESLGSTDEPRSEDEDDEEDDDAGDSDDHGFIVDGEEGEEEEEEEDGKGLDSAPPLPPAEKRSRTPIHQRSIISLADGSVMTEESEDGVEEVEEDDLEEEIAPAHKRPRVQPDVALAALYSPNRPPASRLAPPVEGGDVEEEEVDELADD